LTNRKNHRATLEETLATITQRGTEYGDPRPSFKRASLFASTLLGRTVTPYDVAIVMMSVKLSRISNERKHDSFVDLIAYASFADEYVDDAAPEEALKIRLDNVAADIDENIREIAKTLAPMKGERK
jgi:hypothetical protein